MLARAHARLVPLSLTALAFAFAIAQRPGWSSSDTKIDLHTDPVRFLGEIASLWTPSSGLGGVESAQYAGYLFPMGPFFALGHVLGLGDWLVDRLWLGLLLAVGCWGMVRLAEELGAARSNAASLVAGLAFLLNPYVVVFTNRTTITLLAYALLPWLVLVARRGLREPGRWRRPALFALLVAASGGGVNAAVVALPLLAVVAILLYEPFTGVVPWRAPWQFGWRAVVATVVASLWWIAPTAAQAAYGVDFLRFTEPAGAIWATTSLSESFRAMGYWISYIGVGFNGVVRPYFSDSETLLFNHVVVSATLLVPGLTLLGFTWTRRRRYAAFFLLLILVGTLVMAIGYPEGTPLRRGATFAYNHFASVRFLRTTYKAGPLVVLGLAGLAAMAVDAAGRRRAAVAALGCVLLAIAAWPFVSGRAVDKQVSWKHIPHGWKAAAADLDRNLGDNARAAVLPGQLYAFYRWGGTVDPILPSLTKKPVAVRNAVPYGDMRATDLLWTTDSLLQQGRTVPGQLPALLRMMSVRRVVGATDDDVHRSGASDPQGAARALAAQLPGRPRSYGDGVRGYEVAGARPIVRVEPRTPLEVVDGGAEGLADLAAFGALPTRTAFSYAADLGAPAIRAAARGGGTIVVSDSNRRRVFVVSRMRQNTGWTLPADEPLSADAASVDPFAAAGSDAQTVAVLHGARSISAPFSPGFSQFPEHRPFAAFDGDPATSWLADASLDPPRHTVTVRFTRPRDVGAIDVLPSDDAGARVSAVVVNGRRYPVGSRWSHLELGLRHVSSLSLRVVAARTGSAGAGGLAEVRVPGLRVTESLRSPVQAERALRGADLSHAALTYSFSRASGDDPLHHASSAGAVVDRRVTDPSQLEQLRVASPGDEERAIDRVISPPVARRYDVRAWLSVSPEASDSAIDRLVGVRSPLRADSSGRLGGTPVLRASSALDGDPRTAWVAPWDPERPRASLRVTTAAAGLDIRELRLDPPPHGVRAPARVRLAWPGGATAALPVVGGRVVLPRPVRTRRFQLQILAASGLGDGVGVAELRIAGLERMRVPRSGPIRGCRAVVVRGGAQPVGLRLDSGVAAVDAGRPLRARGCAPLALRAGPQRLRVPPATLRADKVLLSSPAPVPIARSGLPAGSVTDPGDPGRGRRDNVELRVRAPAWLVLGESYNRGWRAWCNGHALGAPVPLDGYANAWRVEAGCTSARFAFAPQTPVRVLQILSVLGCLVLLALALGLPRRRRPDAVLAVDEPARRDWPDEPVRPVAPGRAALAAIVAGGVLAFCFSLRSGLLIAPATFLVLWRAIPAKPLALAGGLLLAIAVPVDYLLFPGKDFGGYNPGYASNHISGHWIAVAAWVLLALALWRALSTARRRRGGPSAAPAAAAE